MARQRSGHSLPELLLALGLFTVAILSFVALSLAVLSSDRKATDTAIGSVVARQLLDKLSDQVRADQPPGTKANFWGSNYISTPWDSGTVHLNQVDLQYTIYAQTAVDTSGTPLGSLSANNLVKKVDVVVSWWGSAQQQRAGYGQLQVRASRLLSQGAL